MKCLNRQLTKKLSFLEAHPLYLFFFLFAISSCNNKAESIHAAGASFPAPLYEKMFAAYSEKTGHKMSYQSIGSGGGVRQLLSGSIDLGATDSFVEDDLLESSGKKIVHIPTCVGGVAITYNLSEIKVPLQLSADVLVAIYSGKIKYWNDPSIREINKGVALPDKQILPVYRTDGSGTTFIFSDFLYKASREGRVLFGRGQNIDWKAGIGAKGNEGLAETVKGTPYSLGYVVMNYVMEKGLPTAAILNSSGNFVLPTLETVSLSAETSLPKDMRINLADSKSERAYPISSFTWLIVNQKLESGKSSAQRSATKHFLKWLITEGQSFTEPLYYSPLPQNAVELSLEIIANIETK